MIWSFKIKLNCTAHKTTWLNQPKSPSLKILTPTSRLYSFFREKQTRQNKLNSLFCWMKSTPKKYEVFTRKYPFSAIKTWTHSTITSFSKRFYSKCLFHMQFIINYHFSFIVDPFLGVDIEAFCVINAEWSKTSRVWKIIALMILIRRWIEVLISHEIVYNFICWRLATKSFIYLFLRCGYSALSTIKTNRSTKDSVEGLFLGSYKIVASLSFIVHPLLLLPLLFVYMQSKILMFWLW